MLNLTTLDLTLIAEALTLAEDKLRYSGETFGPEYYRSLEMARLRERLIAPAPVTVGHAIPHNDGNA